MQKINLYFKKRKRVVKMNLLKMVENKKKKTMIKYIQKYRNKKIT